MAYNFNSIDSNWKYLIDNCIVVFQLLADKSVKITFKIAALGLSFGTSLVHRKNTCKSSS